MGRRAILVLVAEDCTKGRASRRDSERQPTLGAVGVPISGTVRIGQVSFGEQPGTQATTSAVGGSALRTWSRPPFLAS